MYKANHRITHLINANSFFPIETGLLPSPATPLFLRADAQDNIACFPIRALVRLAFKHDLMALGHARCNVQGIMRTMVNNLVSLTVRARPFDDFAPALAVVARHLTLREHAGENLLLDKLYTLTVAPRACMDIPVRGGT